MGTVCKIGDIQKHPNGKWYRKDVQNLQIAVCLGCYYEPEAGGASRCPSSDGRSAPSQVAKPVSDGGCDCRGTIWTEVPAPKKPKPLAKWDKIPLYTKITKSGLIDIANELGTENAKLKNQITKLKKGV